MVITIVFFIAGRCINAQNNTIDPIRDHCFDLDLIMSYFTEFEDIIEWDKGRLWGKPINNKLMFVDPESRILVANRQNAENSFKKTHNVYLGVLENEVGIANTSKIIYGEMWTMINWEFLPKTNTPERKSVMAHEAFHGIQNDVGLPSVSSENQHLESMEGRIYLQLEFRALCKALIHEGEERLQALYDAFLFRNYRYQLYDEAMKSEGDFEKHEGMAEYTGAMLSGYSVDTLRYVLAKRLKDAENEKTYQWYFGYKTGPAYAYLADMYGIHWKSEIRSHDNIAKLLQEKLNFRFDENLLETLVDNRLSAYNGRDLIQHEDSLYQRKVEILESYNTMFYKDTVLQVPLLGGMNISFDPMNAIDLYGLGTVYTKNTHISSSWGVLVSDAPVFLEKNWSYVLLSKPIIFCDSLISGNHWSIQLNEGWIINSSQNPLLLTKNK